MRSRANPNVTTLHSRMMTMTGLDRMAPIQSKLANITDLLVSDPAAGLTPAGGCGQLLDAILGGHDQLAVLRVLHDVAIGLDGARVLLARLVQRRQARERRETERLVAVRTGAGLLVGADRARHVVHLLAAAAEAERHLGAQHRAVLEAQRLLEARRSLRHVARRLVEVGDLAH